ncbi:MAG TPA: replicative DNA helicase [Gaiellaceae bacterium]|nr:replicative DNA helicase [Gaiellaceae bacterium]
MTMPAQALATAPIPPQNLDAEESVLGAMMLNSLAIGAVTESTNLSAADFYRESHGHIYRAILSLYAKGEPVDAITVVDELGKSGTLETAGGSERIHELAALVPAASNAPHYARLVAEMATLRGLIRAGNDIARLGFDRPGETVELVDRAEQIVFDLSQQRVSTEFAHVAELLKDSFETITKLYEAGSDITGTPSGFRDLDRLTSGFQPGNLVIVAARPSMGKSALALCMASNVAVRTGTPVALFTLEMSKAEVTQRLMCAEGKVESQRLRTGKLATDDWPRLTAACDKLAKAPIYVDDTGSITMMEIRSKLRRLKSREQNLGLVIVDYLQLMTSGTTVENRVQEVSQISRSLKVLARDLDVPIIALSQLSRAVEQRHDKRPILSDLRESGCLTGETRVYLPDEGVYRPIGELVGAHGFRVLAVNTETWRLEPQVVTRAFATGTKPVYRLTTRLGHVVRATGNHKFLAFDGWRRLDDLAPGMRVAVPRKLTTAPAGSTMTDSELALLGHLIGDGCTLPRHAIQYTSKDEDLAHLVVLLAKDAFGTRVEPRVKRERTWFQTYLPSTGHLTHGKRNPVAEWLDKLGAFGLRAPEKRVPLEVFRQAPEKVAVFLRHLWATDGCIVAGRGRGYPVVRYDSTSERLTRDVQSLLLRLGIVSSRRRVSMGAKGLASHRLTVSGKTDVERFLDTVGGVGSRKAAACATIRSQLSGVRGNTNRDSIPASAWRTLVVPAMEPAGISTRALQHSLGTSYCGSTLYRSGMSRERAALVAGIVQSEELAALATSDVFWDEIVSIEPDGIEEVYDLTVDRLHNFVAEDVIVHNSIEQDADVVMFVYRDEYYNPEDTESAGIAEVILSKHRNGATGTEKLAFQKRYAKFADLAAAS